MQLLQKEIEVLKNQLGQVQNQESILRKQSLMNNVLTENQALKEQKQALEAKLQEGQCNSCILRF